MNSILKTYNHIKPHELREVFFILLLAVISFGYSQSTNETNYNNTDITAVVIDGNQIFNIDVVAVEGSDIKVSSATDGEYQNDFRVISEVKEGKLYLALERSSLEVMPDDKRNANKVISAMLKIEIPKDKSLTITSDVGSVNLKGNFDKLNIQLKQGDCTVEGLAKHAIIKTINGNISIKTDNAIIQTDSHSGLVNIPNNLFGFNVWELTTISGNIDVKKVKF